MRLPLHHPLTVVKCAAVDVVGLLSACEIYGGNIRSVQNCASVWPVRHTDSTEPLQGTDYHAQDSVLLSKRLTVYVSIKRHKRNNSSLVASLLAIALTLLARLALCGLIFESLVMPDLAASLITMRFVARSEHLFLLPQAPHRS